VRPIFWQLMPAERPERGPTWFREGSGWDELREAIEAQLDEVAGAIPEGYTPGNSFALYVTEVEARS
jgi:hypothetical protein